ncbi:survival motor neuron protein-like [Thunnus maccoyii]|uniref:survival motor neuron protein-like n=1 Tax=Thunnus maccoyii TaxID=8240 RepID=UPI001C4DB7A8|nr:survival motor neuron protein-like [Thunnus maccoyii]
MTDEVKVRPSNHTKVEKDVEEKKKRGNQQRDEGDKPTNHSFSVFLPFPPPPHTSSGDPVSFIPPPPPPPLWLFGESGGSAGVNVTSSMLMLWYMCGYMVSNTPPQQRSDHLVTL